MKRWEAGRCSRYLRGDSRYVKGLCRTCRASHAEHMRSQEYLSPERIIAGVMTEWKERTRSNKFSCTHTHIHTHTWKTTAKSSQQL